MNARAAMEAARAVFEFTVGRVPDAATTSPQWTTPTVPCATPRQRSEALWAAAERTLQAVVGNGNMSGQALVSEGRRMERLTLDDAHALVAMHGWAEQIRHPVPGHLSDHIDVERPPSEFERRIAAEVWTALEHAVAEVHSDTITDTPDARHLSADVAMVGVNTGNSEQKRAAENLRVADAVPPGAMVGRTRAWYASPGIILLVLAVAVFGAAASWTLYRTNRNSALRDGVAAYERGAPEVARMALQRAVNDEPTNPTPLVYLGRISREARDWAAAKTALARAIELQPGNALALREMAATLLAEGQPELARRFYVRTLSINPTDRLAQGFLGCALQQLGRVEESVRWAARAGPGEWSSCQTTTADSPAFTSPSVPRR